MIKVFILSVFVLTNYVVVAKINVEELKCLVCKATFDELKAKLDKLDPTLRTEVGGYQIDSDGNLKRKMVSQTKSEVVLSELIDEVCKTMDDYVRVTWKSNGSLTIMKMLMPDSGMNPLLSEVNFITDDDLNKSLQYYCEEIVEMHEETIIPEIMNDVEDLQKSICMEKTTICPLKSDKVENESDPEFDDEGDDSKDEL